MPEVEEGVACVDVEDPGKRALVWRKVTSRRNCGKLTEVGEARWLRVLQRGGHGSIRMRWGTARGERDGDLRGARVHREEKEH